MDALISWLRELGLERYGAVFAENDVDLDALRLLTDAELEKLGVSLGHRKKLLRAVEALRSADTIAPPRSPDSYTPKHLAEKILTSKSALEGERKQVTVLFADLKGSMELLADRDPEEARKLLDPVLALMMEAVHRYEGTVNQVMGDGIMALFGAPLALEDHAMRACYAALAMQSAARSLSEQLRRSQGVEVQIRAGLNSGEVVVRSIGSDLHMDYTAVGQTTHLAARMEQLATPGTTRLTAATLQLVEGLVAVKPQGPAAVKGLSEPIEVYELTGAGTAGSRLQAAAARGLTKFVGRGAELTQIHHALEQAQAGHGQIIALVGEPGVGKSRLVWEFTHSHRLQGWLVLQSGSVSYGKANAYRPVIDLLKRYFQIEERDEPGRVREKVASKLLMLDRQLEALLPALLFLLDTPLEDPQWDSLDPAQKRLRILEACKCLLLRESQVQPLVLVFEDLHWIDSETQSFLNGMVESLPSARALLLVDYRPEYQQRWGAKTYYLQLRIDPLAGESATALLDTLLGEDASLAPLKRLLFERTEGNPLFLEEGVRTLVETGQLVGSRGTYHLAAPVTGIQMPATVQAILAARIDRLSPENKRLLQAAAVVGKNVPYPLLQAIAEMPEEQVPRALIELQAAEFLYEASLFPELEYTFKHALTHEVAYGSVLRERRRGLHSRIMEAIERRYPDRLTEQVEPLAHHAFRGELWDKALLYLRQAGEKSIGRSANREAIAAYQHALTAAAHLPETRETLEQAIDLRLLLQYPLMALAEMKRNFDYAREAEALVQKLVDPLRQGWVSAFLCQACRNVGQFAEALEHGQRALAITRELDDPRLAVAANYYLGTTYAYGGNYRKAIQFLLRCPDVPTTHSKDPQRPMVTFGLFTTQLYIWAQGFVSWSFAELGAFDEAIVHAKESERAATVLELQYPRAGADALLGHVHVLRGDLDSAIPVLERSLEISLAADLGQSLALVAPPLGSAYKLLGRLAESIAVLEQGRDMAESTRNMLNAPLIAAHLGEAYGLAGRTEEAIATLRRSLELAQRHEHRGSEAWALLFMGNVYADRSPPDEASAWEHYTQAIARARELEMRPLEAQCHLRLGQLPQKTGKREDARQQLSTAASMFREMGMQFWLDKAEAALELQH